MEIDSQDQTSERAELHFLAAFLEELTKSLLANGAMTRAQLQQIEDAASARTGGIPRAW
jgi:hypothetical protein